MQDKRISLMANGPCRLEMHNERLKQKEVFLVHDELGRGGSCMVYRAFACAGEDEDRPVLLKECYPAVCAAALDREAGLLVLKKDAPERIRQRFLKERELFTQSCAAQRKIYRELAADAADELMDIQDEYTAGEGRYVLLHAGSGLSWSSLTPRSASETLMQLLETVLSAARELAVYHKAGWLYGDVKPENVYLFRKTRQHVRLMDFGSMQKLQDGHMRADAALSCSTDYAAPEVLDALGADEADREDYCACVTAKADLYSLCAVMYERLTGKLRHPGMTDVRFAAELEEELEALWRREKNGWLKNIRHTVVIRIRQFLTKALSWSPENRPGFEEIEAQLREIMAFALPQRFELSPRCLAPAAAAGFVGRRKELQRLKELLRQGGGPIWICGDGGLGKSELALRLAQDERENYDFFRVTFREDLKQTILSLPVQPEAPEEDEQSLPESQEAKYQWHMMCLRQYGETGVLIIDQFDLPPEQEAYVFGSQAYADLMQLDMRIILTSRRRPPQSDSCVMLGALEEEELLQLFRACCHGHAEEKTVLELIRSVRYNTLLTELMARNVEQSWGKLTPEQLLRTFSDGTGEKETAVGARIRQLFDLTVLSSMSRRLMAQTCLFPQSGLNAWLCLDCHSEAEQDRLRLLEMSGWIRKTGDNLLTVHPLIREVCRSSLEERDEACAEFLQNYRMHFLALTQKEKTENQYQMADMLSCAASCLSDPEGAYALEAGDANYAAGMYLTALKHLLDYWPVLISGPKVKSLAALSVLDRIASCCVALGRYEEAVHYERSAIQVFENLEGADHPALAAHYENLGSIYKESGLFSEALQAYEKAEKLQGDSTKMTQEGAHLYLNLSKVYERMGRYDEAEKSIRQVLAYDKALPENNVSSAALLASAYTTLGIIHEGREDNEDALKCFDCAAALCEQVWGTMHVRTASSYSDRGAALTHLGRYDEALPWLEKSLSIKKAGYGDMHPYTATDYQNLAELYWRTGRLDQALEACEKARQIRQRFFGAEHPDLARNDELQAAILMETGSRWDEALAYQLRAFLVHYQNEEALRVKPNADRSLQNLHRIYLAAGRNPDDFMVWFDRERKRIGY